VNNNGNANNNNASNSNGVRPISSACLIMLYADTGNEERRSCPCVLYDTQKDKGDAIRYD